MTTGGGNRIPAWLWMVAFVSVWWPVGQAFVWLFLGLVTVFRDFAGVLTACVLSVPAWFATRYAYSHGAPRGLWLTTLVGAFPLFVIFGSLMLIDLPDPALMAVPPQFWGQVAAFALSAAQMAFVLIAPTFVAWRASREEARHAASAPQAGEAGI